MTHTTDPPPFIYAYSWHPGILFVDTFNYNHPQEAGPGGNTQALAGYKISSPEELEQIAAGYNRIYRTSYQGRREICPGFDYDEDKARADFLYSTKFDYYQ